MRPREITKSDLALVYELRHEGWSYEKIGQFIGRDKSYLNVLILRCEREGLGWIKQ